MMMKNQMTCLFLCLFVFLQFNCFKQIGKNLAIGVSEEADSISHELVNGAVESLTDSLNQARINEMANHLVKEVFEEAKIGLNQLQVDSLSYQLVGGVEAALFNPEVKQKMADLVKSVLSSVGTNGKAEIDVLFSALLDKLRSKEMDQTINHLRRDLLGAKTSQAINRLLQQSLDSLDTKKIVGDLRDELLNAKTNAALRTIIDSAMVTIAYRIKKDINPVLKTELNFIQKYARGLLISAGLLVFGIIAFSWYQRRKYLRMTTLLASEIHQIPDQKIYDVLTRSIKDKAIVSSIEPELRKLLKSNGLLGEEAWKSTMKKQ